MPTVSESTFNPSSCTLSGYWKAKFAEHGTVNADNVVTLATVGYRSLASITSVYDNTSNGFTTDGFYSDLALTSDVNPLGQVGLSYCQCVAVIVNGCKSPTADFKNAPIAGQPLPTLGVGGLKMDTTTETALDVRDIRGDYSYEYASIDLYVEEAFGGVTATTFDKQSEADTVQAIFDSLPSELDQCATMAFDYVQ